MRLFRHAHRFPRVGETMLQFIHVCMRLTMMRVNEIGVKDDNNGKLERTHLIYLARRSLTSSLRLIKQRYKLMK